MRAGGRMCGFALGVFIGLCGSAAAQNSWVEWTGEPTTGDTCSAQSTPEDEVTHRKQWHAYWRNTCWDQSQPTWYAVHPLTVATGECGIGGCFPVFQAYAGWNGNMLWWDGTGTDYDWFFGYCREGVVHHDFFEAEAHNDTDPPCPAQPDCSNCTYPAQNPNECALDDGAYFREDCQCCVEPWTPIVINLRGSIKMSSAENGVMFDFLGNAMAERMAWPLSPDDGWLVLDRNGDGAITSGRELFGNQTVLADGRMARNGFVALRELDQTGDGLVDQSDPRFPELAVWQDGNRNGVAEAGELVPLSAAGIISIAVSERLSSRVDRWGNRFRYRAPVSFVSGEIRFAHDVILARLSTTPPQK